MMVRDPRYRLWSAFAYDRHAFGLSVPHGLLEQQVKTPRDFVEFPGIRGCQVKMLTGYSCASAVTVTPAMLEQAKAVVREAAFVGLTEAWNDSICLFSAMYGGPLPAVAFANTRQTDGAGQLYNKDEALLHYSAADDPDDWQLYLTAKQRFSALQLQYGLPSYRHHDTVAARSAHVER